jgi:hypothetical protein
MTKVHDNHKELQPVVIEAFIGAIFKTKDNSLNIKEQDNFRRIFFHEEELAIASTRRSILEIFFPQE